MIFENARPVSFPHSVLESEGGRFTWNWDRAVFFYLIFPSCCIPHFLSGRHLGVTVSCSRASAGCPQGLGRLFPSDAWLARCVLGVVFTFFWLFKVIVVDERPDREDSGGSSHFKIPVECLIVLYLMWKCWSDLNQLGEKNYAAGHSAETREASWFSLRTGMWITYKECVVIPHLWLQGFELALLFLLVVL